MAKAVADVDGDNTGGFASDGSSVTGFSQMHDSGTGGVSEVNLKNFLVSCLLPTIAWLAWELSPLSSSWLQG